MQKQFFACVESSIRRPGELGFLVLESPWSSNQIQGNVVHFLVLYTLSLYKVHAFASSCKIGYWFIVCLEITFFIYAGSEMIHLCVMNERQNKHQNVWTSKIIKYKIFHRRITRGGRGGEVLPAVFWKLEKSALILEKNALTAVLNWFIYGLNFSFKV